APLRAGPVARGRGDSRGNRGAVRRLGEEVKDQLGRFSASAGMPELLEAWPAAVGETIARNAWPARIARDGTLHVNTADAIWAFELTSRAADIAKRLGVDRIRFAPGRVPEAVEPGPERPSRRPLEPSESLRQEGA